MYEVYSHVMYIMLQYNALLYVMYIILSMKQGCLIDAGIKEGDA